MLHFPQGPGKLKKYLIIAFLISILYVLTEIGLYIVKYAQPTGKFMEDRTVFTNFELTFMNEKYGCNVQGDYTEYTHKYLFTSIYKLSFCRIISNAEIFFFIVLNLLYVIPIIILLRKGCVEYKTSKRLRELQSNVNISYQHF